MSREFVDVCIVDSFYQTSSFFPMPVVLVSTLAESGKNQSGSLFPLFPLYRHWRQSSCHATNSPPQQQYRPKYHKDQSLFDQLHNCSEHPNGPYLGTCANQLNENLVWISGNSCRNDGDCEADQFCETSQLDSNQNGIGDVCECEPDFDCDEDVDGFDLMIFRDDFGRSQANNWCPPCNTSNPPCEADFDGDCDVDGHDLYKMQEDFGRSVVNNPCPACS